MTTPVLSREIAAVLPGIPSRANERQVERIRTVDSQLHGFEAAAAAGIDSLLGRAEKSSLACENSRDPV